MFVGFTTALVAAVLFVLGGLFLPVYAASLVSWALGDGGGIAGGSADLRSAMSVAVFGFVLGCGWVIWRARRRQSG